MEVREYVRGLNEWLDTILDEGVRVWRINGDRGLRPITADSEEEAVERYLELPKR